MQPYSYDQIANYEAALELMNTLRGIFLSLSKDDTKYQKHLKNRAFEIGKEKQQLEPIHDTTIANIRATYAPLVQSYYTDPKAFAITKDFINTKADYDRH